MKKAFISIILALAAVAGLHAESFTGNIVVTRNGMTFNQEVTVTVTPNENGLYTLNLSVPVFGTMVMSDVPAAMTDGVTVYSADRDVATSLGTMRTILFARTVNGMMAANLSLPDQNATMWFNTVGNHFQLPNCDMEAWTNSNGEPDRWHGFKTATGMWAFAAPALLGKSEDIHEGASGQYSAVITAKSAFGTIANGTMTSGRLNAGATSATSTDNNASTSESYGDDFYMPIAAKPDQFKVWLKFEPKNANNKANVSVKTFDGTYYQEPIDKTYTNLSGSIVGGEIAACDWTQFTFPFDYDSYAANNADTKAIFVTVSTNANPGQGSDNDKVYIDDMELVYLGSISDLRYKGETINGWNPAVTTYSMEIQGEPNLDDFTADIEGASAVLTKSMEQNADGSYRIAISVVSADLQNGACYIINATVAATGRKGDVNDDGIVDIGDVTDLISRVLGYGEVIESRADLNGDNMVDVGDVTELISIVLGNS